MANDKSQKGQFLPEGPHPPTPGTGSSHRTEKEHGDPHLVQVTDRPMPTAGELREMGYDISDTFGDDEFPHDYATSTIRNPNDHPEPHLVRHHEPFDPDYVALTPNERAKKMKEATPEELAEAWAQQPSRPEHMTPKVGTTRDGEKVEE